MLTAVNKGEKQSPLRGGKRVGLRRCWLKISRTLRMHGGGCWLRWRLKFFILFFDSLRGCCWIQYLLYINIFYFKLWWWWWFCHEKTSIMPLQYRKTSKVYLRGISWIFAWTTRTRAMLHVRWPSSTHREAKDHRSFPYEKQFIISQRHQGSAAQKRVIVRSLWCWMYVLEVLIERTKATV